MAAQEVCRPAIRCTCNPHIPPISDVTARRPSRNGCRVSTLLVSCFLHALNVARSWSSLCPLACIAGDGHGPCRERAQGARHCVACGRYGGLDDRWGPEGEVADRRLRVRAWRRRLRGGLSFPPPQRHPEPRRRGRAQGVEPHRRPRRCLAPRDRDLGVCGLPLCSGGGHSGRRRLRSGSDLRSGGAGDGPLRVDRRAAAPPERALLCRQGGAAGGA